MKNLRLILIGFSFLFSAGCFPTTESATPTPIENGLQTAEETLVSFFEFVSAGQYQDAVAYYAGPSDDLVQVLQDWHPGWQPPENDPTAVLEKICTGGFQCLPLRRIVAARRISATRFEFEVELNRHDGELFVFGPCCGASETEMPPQTVFTYQVMQTVNGRYLVEWSPIYVP